MCRAKGEIVSDTQDQHDELRDRLADQALREVLAGEEPPDLSTSILAAARQAPPGRRVQRPAGGTHRRWWIVLTTAASVAIVAGFYRIVATPGGHVPTAQHAVDQVEEATAKLNEEFEIGQASSRDLPVTDLSSTDSGVAAEPPADLTAGAIVNSDFMVVDKPAGEDFRIAEGAAASRSLASSTTSGYGDQDGEQNLYEVELTPLAERTETEHHVERGKLSLSAQRVAPEEVQVQIAGQATPKQKVFSEEAKPTSRLSLQSGKEVRGGYVAGAGYGGGGIGGGATGISSGVAGGFGVMPAAGDGSFSAPSDGLSQVLSRSVDTAYSRGFREPDAKVLRSMHLVESEVRERESKLRGEIARVSERIQAVSSGERRERRSAVNQSAVKQTLKELGDLQAELKQLTQEYEQNLARQAGTGSGPDDSGDQYQRIYENPFIVAQGEDAVSTFSIDVDTASYTNVRQFLLGHGQLPPPDAVRIEELVNYFDYTYQPPTDGKPFAASVEIAGCPWQPNHRLVRVGIKGHEIARDKRPASNLVFLVDVSGSMDQSNKLPLVVEGLKQLTRELTENDRVAIVVYANAEGLALPSTPGSQRERILGTLGQLKAGGSTAGGAGIQLAYKIAQDHFVSEGTNRVILCTDGDFNVGVTSTAELERLAEEKAQSGVFLTVLGFGRGNLNDAMMEAISNRGNGNYHYIDNVMEARKVLVRQMAGTLITIAKDVKIQIEFNPGKVAGYRLLGYENRVLATEDFNDDTKDAGEIGAGHTVTALYEVVPAGQKLDVVAADQLKYQQQVELSKHAESDELLTLKLRYKKPDGEKSTKLEFPIRDEGKSFARASGDFKFASAVVEFGLLLRDSQHKGNATVDAVLEIAAEGAQPDEHGYRENFLNMVRRAKELGL